MNETLTTAQRQELKTRLLAVRKDLQDQMQQNRENLAPPAADQDGIVQGNVGREVDQALTNIDAADLARIDMQAISDLIADNIIRENLDAYQDSLKDIIREL